MSPGDGSVEAAKKHRWFRAALSRVLPRRRAPRSRTERCATMPRNDHRGGSTCRSCPSSPPRSSAAAPSSARPGPAPHWPVRCPTGKPEDVGLSSERLARIGPAMQRHIDAGEIAGVVTLVARRGRIVHFEAYGYSDIAKRTPMRTDAHLRLGVVVEADHGRRDPDARRERRRPPARTPCRSYIPEFAAPAQVAVAETGRRRRRVRSGARDAADHGRAIS